MTVVSICCGPGGDHMECSGVHGDLGVCECSCHELAVMPAEIVTITMDSGLLVHGLWQKVDSPTDGLAIRRSGSRD